MAHGSSSLKTAIPHSSALTVDAFSLWYGNKRILREVGFTLPRHGVTALLGPSGCGKSSLVLTLAGLNGPTTCCTTKGILRWEGAPARVGVVFQKPLAFPLSIRENVALALKERRKWARSDLDAAVEKALVKAHLWDEVKDRLRGPASTLSGGQLQRLSLARALALEPDVLLLDEPCSSLDPVSSAVIEETIRELARETSILIVTHNLAQARRIAGRCILLWDQGEGSSVLEQGNTIDVFADAKHPLARSYLSGLVG